MLRFFSLLFLGSFIFYFRLLTFGISPFFALPPPPSVGESPIGVLHDGILRSQFKYELKFQSDYQIKYETVLGHGRQSLLIDRKDFGTHKRGRSRDAIALSSARATGNEYSAPQPSNFFCLFRIIDLKRQSVCSHLSIRHGFIC